jgi:esterase/lipase superfamily enzyme
MNETESATAERVEIAQSQTPQQGESQRVIGPERFSRIQARHQRWLDPDDSGGVQLLAQGVKFTAGPTLVKMRKFGFRDRYQLPRIMPGSLDECVAIECEFRGLGFATYFFRDAILWNTSFEDQFLRWARFEGADCEGASFEGADLTRANFRNACLASTNFRNARLSYADFEGADLENADFEGADLSEVSFDHATLVRTNFKGANLKAITAVGAFIADSIDSVSDNYRHLVRERGPFAFPEHTSSYVSQKIFYATDRKRSSETHPNWYYLNEQTDPSIISTGRCEVRSPGLRGVGKGSSEVWFDIQELPEQSFEHEIADAASKAETPDVLIFIHGFRVKFADGLRRFAHVIEDMSFKGVPLFYSWSSAGKAGEYDVDAERVNLARHTLRPLLNKLVNLPGIERLHLMAHSMGGRALLEVVRNAQQALSGEVIFSAPDVGVQDFRQAFPLTKPPSRVTLYASSKDLALRLSARWKKMDRAGYAGEKLVVIREVDTVDTSNVADKPTGHSYFAASRPVLEDSGYLVREGLSPGQRANLRSLTRNGVEYWKFRA